MSLILLEFPEVVRTVSVGKTYQKNDMAGFIIGYGFSEENWESEASTRPAILIDGLHHSRELTGLSLQMYTLLRILFDYEKNDSNTIILLN